MPLPEITPNLSPMMKQYVEIKKEHPDMLLFYRLGDFYEMFFDDAETASRELELILTGRDCGLANRAPMCGVPYHSYEGYVARLIAKGYKVAICEQVENPAAAKGIVKREIVRVVTPGTVTENSMLDENANNYICALFLDSGGFGAAFADISTGIVYVTEAAGRVAAMVNELARFEPREILCNAAAYENRALRDFAEKTLNVEPALLYDGSFALDVCRTYSMRQFGEALPAELMISSDGKAVRALGALVQYIRETQFHGASRLVSIEIYRCTQYLALSASCRRNLELTATMRMGDKRGSLLWAIDRTLTAMGRRQLRAFLDKPLVDAEAINRRLDSVGELYGNTVLLAQLRDSLKGIFDIERLMTRVTYRSCTPRDLTALIATCGHIAELAALAEPLLTPLVRTLCDSLDPLDDICGELRRAICDEPPALLKDGGYIRAGFDSNIDELRGLLSNSKSYLARMEASLKESTGIKNLKIGYNRVFGYYIEVSRLNTEKVPDSFVRKQTLTTGERYINEELKTLEEKILSASERIDLLERQHFEALLDLLERNLKRVQTVAGAVAYLDVLTGFAALARDNGYCRPLVDNGDSIEIKNGRHPVVELVLRDELFVPNDTLLDCGGNLVSIITGPNMAGKSTYMRQTAIIVLMAQMGCFVPAASARIGAVDAIFTRVGATDDLFAGDSTFMVEMKEVAEILREATQKSLIILDEIGRGTSTFDGMSIARAVVEQICGTGGIGAKTLFATHYHELTDMESDFNNVKNYNIAVKKRGNDITFLRRIVAGPTDESYGIEVARLAGLPDAAIVRAREILTSLETREPHTGRPALTETEESPNQELLAALAAIQPESLTPIEAMIKLHELKNLAQREEVPAYD